MEDSDMTLVDHDMDDYASDCQETCSEFGFDADDEDVYEMYHDQGDDDEDAQEIEYMIMVD